MKTIKPTDWEVYCQQLLWQARNPGVCFGIEPLRGPYFRRMPLLDVDDELVVHYNEGSATEKQA